jgi:hypothetical protein
MVIFVSSIGRSGTRYIADLFSHCTDIRAEHAAQPLCHGDVMVDVYSGVRRPEVETKARIIQGMIAEHGAYFESTQVFTRVLAETFLDFFPPISVIHMLRDPMEIACSYMNRRSYPSHPDRPWRLPLNLKRSLFRFPQSLTPLQENLCDWLENELRFMELQPRFGRTVEFDFTNFGSAAHICTLFESLGVEFRRDDVLHHVERQDLERNANRRKTRVSRKDRQQASALIESLQEHGFPTALFRHARYNNFEFTQRLAATIE